MWGWSATDRRAVAIRCRLELQQWSNRFAGWKYRPQCVAFKHKYIMHVHVYYTRLSFSLINLPVRWPISALGRSHHKTYILKHLRNPSQFIKNVIMVCSCCLFFLAMLSTAASLSPHFAFWQRRIHHQNPVPEPSKELETVGTQKPFDPEVFMNFVS